MAHLPELDHTASCACESGAMCADIRPGHGLHALQLRLAAATPSRWDDALVVDVCDDGWVSAVTLEGTSVSLHSIYNVLCAGARRFNVLAQAA
jgi:hypothetical protein